MIDIVYPCLPPYYIHVCTAKFAHRSNDDNDGVKNGDDDGDVIAPNVPHDGDDDDDDDES